MHIVKLDAIGSTNTYLKEYSRTFSRDEDILVWTLNQYSGRGQMGTQWESEPGQNLVFSVFKRVRALPINHQFYITAATSLALCDLLTSLGVENVQVKWPNDILAGKEKICGILIESVIKNGRLHAVIIGVGLNVNQEYFNWAPRATSLKLKTGKTFKVEDILNKLVELFYKYVELITQGKFKELKESYESNLFRKGLVSTFSFPNQNKQNGIIEGVTDFGKLRVSFEDNPENLFGLKEITLLY